MRRFAKHGFTLAEVLVVIAVIGLLVAVLVPVLDSAFTYQRYVNCAHNLSELGVAYGTMYADRRMHNLVGIGGLDSGWPGLFAPYVSGAQSVFWCPAVASGGVMQMAKLDEYFDEVYIGSSYQGTVSLSAEPGVFLWKLSQTQFTDLANTPNHGKNYNYTGYQPDSTPNIYYFCMEDMAWQSNPDKDFWDIIFKIETLGVDITLTCVRGQTGYIHNFYYLHGGVRVDIWRDCRNYDGQSVQVKGVGVASYGVNTVADQVLPGKGGKILIMDYDVVTAAGSPYDETGGRAAQLAKDWQPDPKNPANGPHFARHWRKADVLFTDGSVKLMPIADIHPGIPRNCAEYWNPQQYDK